VGGHFAAQPFALHAAASRFRHAGTSFAQPPVAQPSRVWMQRWVQAPVLAAQARRHASSAHGRLHASHAVAQLTVHFEHVPPHARAHSLCWSPHGS
jgi:hypothetical protein